MANHKSAKKRARQNVERGARNAAVKTRVKNAVRSFREKLATKGEGSAAALKVATQVLQRAASKGVLHKRTAARRVSRLTRAHNKA